MENPIKMDYLGVPLFLETPLQLVFFLDPRSPPWPPAVKNGSWRNVVRPGSGELSDRGAPQVP